MVEHDTRALHLAARDRAAERLQARRAAGQLTSAAVRESAAELGISERTMWRALDPARPPIAARGLPDGWMERYLRWGGNVAAVWRELEAEGGAGCSQREIQRRFAELLTAAERAAALGGEQARRSYSLHLRWEAEHRNEVWQADHKQLDVLVIAPGHSRPRAPWVTWCLDDHSRAVMGWALSLQPSSAEVLAALRASMLGDPLHGRPRRLRVDNGLEFTAQAIREACAALDVELDLTRPYAPQEKGKVERLHRTLKDTLLAGLPHFTGGPRAANGQLEAPGAPLLLGQLVDLFASWVQDYNARPHSALGGRSPLEAFTEDPTPLRQLTDEQARTLLLARKTARVHRDGIHFRRLIFTAAGLADLVGETVQIAYTPHDDRHIEVFHRGAWRCTALPQQTLTADQCAEVLIARRTHARDLRRRQQAAARSARTRLAPITAEDPAAVEVTELSTADTAPPRLRLVAAEARTDLLLEHERARQS